MSRFSIESLLCQSNDKLGRGTLLRSTKTLVSIKFMDESEGRREGEKEGARVGLSRFSV